MNASDSSIQDVSPIFDLPAVDVHLVTPTDSEPHEEPSVSPYNQNITCLSTPFQPKNFKFPKKAYGKQFRSFQTSWFDLFPWIHYNEENDSILCFICAKKNEKNYLLPATKKEQAFISTGYSNWKKALQRFKEHQCSECHRLSVDYEVNILKTHGNIYEISNQQTKNTLKSNRRCFIKIIECLQHMSRQGQPIQGDIDSESNFIQLLKLRSKDDPALLEWIQRKNTDKYMTHDIQNEIICIMAHQVQRDLASDIRGNFFSIIADEYTDVSNDEQLTICLRWVDEMLDVHEDFLGFYKIPNIASDTVVSVIKDTFIRLQLSFQYCRGQCYDGASNMLGKRSGVAKRIQDIQPKAKPTHCHGHSLSLGVKDATKNCQILSDAMNNTNEIVKLVKFSPKRENLLEQIKNNVEDDNEMTPISPGLTKFSATRWTVRATCFQRILDNYDELLTLWNECLKMNLEPDIRGRIVGCQAQMRLFNFFFGLILSQRIFSHTDNLSKTLQEEKMSAANGQYNANLTKEVLIKIRNENCFTNFYDTVLQKKQFHTSISHPELPRRRRAPARFEIGSETPYFPETAKDLYRKVYFEALDLVIASIGERFNQPSFVVYKHMETLLIGFLKSEDISLQIEYLKENYPDDIKMEYLSAQLEIFKELMKNTKIVCFSDVLNAVKSLDTAQKHMISEVIVICKLIQVNPATSASAERSFSMARRVKTWLRANMSQKRFTHLALLNSHKNRTDRIRLIDVANEFASVNENRKRNFATFTEADLS